ncbi:MAG: glycosyltransferase family 2 protein [Vulcanimicrobiaceae bacterium]
MTVSILTRDEERHLPRALTSLPRGMPVLVLDAQSKDRTVEYASSAGAEVLLREWTDFVDARTYALTAVRTTWTFVLDADEALDERLREAIAQAPDDVDGYIVRRTTYFCGKPLRMWRNEPLLRLVRTGRARVVARPATGGDAALHERLICEGRIGELDGTLLHYSYPTVESYRSKFARYTAIEAAGKRASVPRALAATIVAPLRFVDYLLRRGAALDGPRGWYVAWWSAWYPAAVAWKAVSGNVNGRTS